MEVMNPPKHSDVTLIPKAIGSWTMKINNLKKDHDEELSPNMKNAVLLFMLPVDIQDLFYQNAKATNTHEETRDKVKVVVNNRLARSGKHGTPMDIGEVAVNRREEWGNEVYAFGKGPCHTCGEHGHFSRECPKGGGSKGKGKDGKGKGFNGECWVCGEFGHSSRYCKKREGQGRQGLQERVQGQPVQGQR
jgi:hypothetical protein